MLPFLKRRPFLRARSPFLFITLIVFLLRPVPVFSETIRQAMDQAAEYFVKQAVKIEPGENLHILEIRNYSSKKHDMLGKRIETELYYALDRLNPDFHLYLGRAEIQEKDIFLYGWHEQKAGAVSVKLRVVKNRRILAQTEVKYDTRTYRRALVAVLDIEAASLSNSQRKAFSDIFRTEFDKQGIFDLASSAEIDKMSPDDIQRATGCTRDTCATIIGEQLGVDRVISSSLSKIDTDYYVLAGKMMDIRDGSILISRTVKHTGNIRTLDRALAELAWELSKFEHQKEPEEAISQTDDAMPTQKSKISTTEEASSNLIWHISAITLAAGSAYMAVSNASSYNELASEYDDLNTQYENSVSREELQTLQDDLDSTKEEMKTHKSNMQMFNAITAVALLWEGYLILFGGDDSEIARSYPVKKTLSPAIIGTKRFNNTPNITVSFEVCW